MQKSVSCGVIITDKKVVLALQPYGKKKKRDLPKGRQEPGESYIQAAIREAREETSLNLKGELLIDIGHFNYTQEKDVHLFLCIMENLPEISSLKCESTFMNDYGKEVPEAVAFEYVSFRDPRFYTGLQPILALIEETFNEDNDN